MKREEGTITLDRMLSEHSDGPEVPLNENRTCSCVRDCHCSCTLSLPSSLSCAQTEPYVQTAQSLDETLLHGSASASSAQGGPRALGSTRRAISFDIKEINGNEGEGRGLSYPWRGTQDVSGPGPPQEALAADIVNDHQKLLSTMDLMAWSAAVAWITWNVIRSLIESL